jgi:hypothetical protein
MSHSLVFHTVLTLSIAGTEAEYACRVTGTYLPFSKGDGPMSYHGPTPDEPEAFEVSAVFARPDENHHFQQVPSWLISQDQWDALEREGIEANTAQRDEAMARNAEESADIARIFGEPGEDDAD